MVSVALRLPVADGPLYMYGDTRNDLGQHFYDHGHIFLKNIPAAELAHSGRYA
jgi:hypothetical protein